MINKNSSQKEISEFFLYNTGALLIGDKAKDMDRKAVEVAGLISCLGHEYARIKGIKAASVELQFQNQKINFLDKNGKILDSLVITTENIANPGQWLDLLYKENNVKL